MIAVIFNIFSAILFPAGHLFIKMFILPHFENSSDTLFVSPQGDVLSLYHP